MVILEGTRYFFSNTNQNITFIDISKFAMLFFCYTDRKTYPVSLLYSICMLLTLESQQLVSFQPAKEYPHFWASITPKSNAAHD